MVKHYADTVRLLLAIAPDVFANDTFALKGGTAINLFAQDIPRLSVDIDVKHPASKLEAALDIQTFNCHRDCASTIIGVSLMIVSATKAYELICQ